MDQNFFSQNPAFQNISPEKLAFLMNFMNQEKPNSSRDMMAFLMNFVAKAQNQNLSFTTDETDFIIQHLRQGLNPAEQQRIECCKCCGGKNNPPCYPAHYPLRHLAYYFFSYAKRLSRTSIILLSPLLFTFSEIYT